MTLENKFYESKSLSEIEGEGFKRLPVSMGMREHILLGKENERILYDFKQQRVISRYNTTPNTEDANIR